MSLSTDGAVLSVMVLMSLVDGRIADGEVVRIRWVFEQLTGRSLSDEDVRLVADQVRSDGTDLDAHLAEIAGRLPLEARRTALKAAFAIATADGQVVAPEDDLMRRIGSALGIGPDDYNAIASHMRMARELV